MNEYYNELIKGLTIERDALKARVVELEKERDEATERVAVEIDNHMASNKAHEDDYARLEEKLRNTFGDFKSMQARAESAESSLATSRRQVDMLKDALRPFYAAVFNDNGDVTVSTGHLRVEHWLKLSNTISALDASQPEARDAVIAEAAEIIRRFAFPGPHDVADHSVYERARAFDEKHGVPKPTKMLVSQEWLDRKIATDPDIDGDITPKHPDEMAEEELLAGLEEPKR